MNNAINKISLSVASITMLLIFLSSTNIDKPITDTSVSAKDPIAENNGSLSCATGDLLGFYTQLFSSGTMNINIVSFPKMNGVNTILGPALSSISYPSSVLLPTNTSAYDANSEDYVCLISGQQHLMTYDDGSCTSTPINLAPSWATAPVFLGGQLYGIDIENSGYGTGPQVDIEIVSDIQTGIINGVAPFQFSPIPPYLFNHEQMSSATNGIDELYFVSGNDLIKVTDPGTPNIVINHIQLDINNKFHFYGLEYSSPNVLLALRINNSTNPISSLDLVEIHLNGVQPPTFTTLYNLQNSVVPSPPGWILNNEFYSSALDTCNQYYYVSTLHTPNGSSKLIEIDIAHSTHVEQIFTDYLFGIEMRGLPCDNCTADFDYTFIDSCGLAQFTSFANVPGTIMYSWNFGDTASGLNNSSISSSPSHQFSSCGTYNVTLTIECPDGTILSSVQSITITDNIPPIAVCVLPFGVGLDSNCTFIVTPAMIDGGSSDNCQIQSMNVSPTILSGCGIFPITLTVVDWCGNVSTCTTEIQTIEVVPPVIICPQNVTVILSSPSPCDTVVNGIQWLSATDNCGILSINYNITGATSLAGNGDASGQTFNQGVSTVTYTATDSCGNVDSCSFMVTVDCDTIPSFPGISCGEAVMTCYSFYDFPTTQDGYVMGLVDVRNRPVGVLPYTWSAPMYHHPDWVRSKLGEIFGIAIHTNKDIFVTATQIYLGSTTPMAVGNGGTAGIYKISGTTGGVTTFVSTNPSGSANTVNTNTLPNSGSGLGNICYDQLHDQFFVTNFEDGRIYRIAASGATAGTVLERYDPFNPDDGTDGMVCLGERLWGVGYYAGRVYFGRWNEHTQFAGPVANEIYSIDINANGSFGNNLIPEIILSPFASIYGTQTNPVSDIEFSHSGKMLISERSMGSAGSCDFYAHYHSSRVLEYTGVSGNWATPSQFYIGNYNPPVHANSAGGVDYGYQGVDPTTNQVFGCDSMVWTTGDALRLDIQSVYGLAGIPSSGNAPAIGLNFTPLNAWYIDADGEVTLQDKNRIGDVDIFKCECPDLAEVLPCDSTLMATQTQVAPLDSCCWAINMKIMEPGICKVEYEVITQGVIFNQFASIWPIKLDPIKPNSQISVSNPPGDIPVGLYPGAVDFCLTNIKNPSQVPQQVVVKYFKTFMGEEVLFCKDTLEFFCEPPLMNNGCWSAVVDSVFCNPDSMSYTIKITVTNEDSVYTYSQFGILNTLPNACFTLSSPSLVTFNTPLAPGDSEQVCLTVNSNQYKSDTTNVYFQFFLFSDMACCHATDSLCVPLPPCCLACDNSSVEIDSSASQFDSCCYTMDFHNGCAKDYFKRIETVIITPGVTFSQAQVVSNPPGWYSPYGVDTAVHWAFQGGYLPFGDFDNLINFCLTNIQDTSQFPQCVEIKWIACNDAGEDIVACRDTLKFYCPPIQKDSCIDVVESNIACLPDGSYQYNYTIKNISPHYASHFSIYHVTPVTVTVTPFPVFVSANLNPCDTYSGSLNISGATAGTSVKLKVRLFDFTPPLPGEPIDTSWCCFDTICLTLPLCDSCVCDQNLSLSQNGVEYPVFCNPHTGFIPTLACPEGDVIVSGFFGCVNPSTGELCPETSVDWTLQWNSNPISSGTTTNFPSWILPDTLVHDPGLYCLTVSTICPGTMDTCLCKIQWIREECDTCFCGSYTDLNYRPLPGVPNIPVECGETLIAQCNGLTPWSLGGTFLCDGDDCPDSTQQYWELIKPNGSISDSMFADPGFNISISGSEFDTTGMYLLILKSICGTDTCYCEFPIIVDECDTCACEGFWSTEFIGDWGPASVSCDNQIPVQLSCPGQLSWFHGNTGCIDSCLQDSVNWELQFGSSTVASGAVSLYFLNPSLVGHFDIPFDDSDFIQPGTYTLTVNSHCSGNDCSCTFTFTVPPCNSACSCDDPIFAVDPTIVKSIFSVVHKSGCTKYFYPAFNLTSCDTIIWSYQTSTSSVLMGTSNGNGALVFTFPAAGTYYVCMKIRRTEPDGTICEEVRCQKIVVHCGVPPFECNSPKLFNPGFFEGAVAGDLSGAGKTEGWVAAFGTPEVYTEEGCGDDAFIRLEGNRVMSDGISTSTLDLKPGLAYSLSFCYRKRRESCEPKGEMKVRLSDGSQDGLECAGDCVLIGEYSLEGEEEIWHDFTGFFIPDKEYKTLTIHVSNASAIPSNLSSFDIDNLCIQPFDFVNAIGDPPARKDIRIFPNPTDGTFHVRFEDNAVQSGSIEIIDLWGRTLRSVSFVPGQNNQEVDVNMLPAGIYFVNINENGFQVYTGKIVKQ